eukprot:TRINITY_DN2573_c0_g1_i10.p1 TRINITY_DN2573_c0_g1~~TRINITY_DN2573_c0_g1_i10.p1  ORF type:complete len:439 (-),score=70.10 TRINITY_DN2573_c0_g1_i10:1056-2372(-)
MRDPEMLHNFKAHKDVITALHFNPTQKQVASSSMDNSILLWNWRTDKKAFKFTGHSDAVLDVNFSRSGHLMASCGRDRSIRLWVPNVKGESTEFKAHQNSVRSVEFSPENLRLVSASDDKTVKIWAVHRNRFVQSLTEHTNWVRCARWSPDNGKLIVSCSDDKTIKLWDESTGSCIHTFTEAKGFGHHVEFHPSGSCIGVGTSDGKIKVFDIRAMKLQQYYATHEAAVTQVNFHPSGNYLVSSSQDMTVRLHNLLTVKPICSVQGHEKAVNTVVFSPQGEYFASGGADGKIFVWKSNLETEGSEEGGYGSGQKSSSQMKEDTIGDSPVLRLHTSNNKENTEPQPSDLDDLPDKLANTRLSKTGGGILKSSTTSATNEVDNSEVLQELRRMGRQFGDMTRKMDRLTETVLYMEKRLSLVEEQVKLVSKTSSAVGTTADD